MGYQQWAGRSQVGVCDIEWSASGLRNVKPDAIDPSEVSCSALWGAQPALRSRQVLVHACDAARSLHAQRKGQAL